MAAAGIGSIGEVVVGIDLEEEDIGLVEDLEAGTEVGSQPVEGSVARTVPEVEGTDPGEAASPDRVIGIRPVAELVEPLAARHTTATGEAVAEDTVAEVVVVVAAGEREQCRLEAG